MPSDTCEPAAAFAFVGVCVGDVHMPVGGCQHPVAEILRAVDAPAGVAQRGRGEGKKWVQWVSLSRPKMPSGGPVVTSQAGLTGWKPAASSAFGPFLLVQSRLTRTATIDGWRSVDRAGFETRFAIDKGGNRHVVFQPGEIHPIAPVPAPTPAVQGLQAEHGLAGRGVDGAAASAPRPGARKIGATWASALATTGSSTGDNGGRASTSDGRAAVDGDPAGLAAGGVEIHGRIGADDQLGGGLTTKPGLQAAIHRGPFEQPPGPVR